MSYALVFIGLAAIAAFGAWMTTHDRKRLTDEHRRRRSDK